LVETHRRRAADVPPPYAILLTMRITRVSSTITAIPRTATLATAYGTRDDATTVIVEIETDEGISGIGQTAVDPPHFGAAGMKANIDTYLTPAIIGKSPLDIEALHVAMERALPGYLSTRGAVDIALWDVKGKALGVPVYQLLGGKLREGITLMAMVPHGTPEAIHESTQRLLATPYPALKVKIGMGMADDLARYAAVREAAGNRAVIQVDGNGGYSLAQAISALGAMQRLGGLGMIEQPVTRLDDLADLARRFTVPIMADESLDSPDAMLDLVTRGAAQAGFLKIHKVGGLTNAVKIAHIAEIAGIELSVAVYYDVLAAVAAHVAAALPAITWPSFVNPLADTLLTEPLVPKGLLFPVPNGPGLGVTLDRDKLRTYEVES
jgi:L-Ala-D/L-Glu epimerase / N-acetyl-D-glutamate racemase